MVFYSKHYAINCERRTSFNLADNNMVTFSRTKFLDININDPLERGEVQINHVVKRVSGRSFIINVFKKYLSSNNL